MLHDLHFNNMLPYFQLHTSSETCTLCSVAVHGGLRTSAGPERHDAGSPAKKMNLPDSAWHTRIPASRSSCLSLQHLTDVLLLWFPFDKLS